MKKVNSPKHTLERPKPSKVNESDNNETLNSFKKATKKESLISLPSEDISGPKSPANKYPYARQTQPAAAKKETLTADNTNASTRLSNFSGKASAVQNNNVTSPNNYVDRVKVGREKGSIPPPNNPSQDSSIKTMPTEQFSKKEAPVKSSSKIEVKANNASSKTIHAKSPQPHPQPHPQSK